MSNLQTVLVPKDCHNQHQRKLDQPCAERPILFSGAMVRAILDRRKTQTRRVIKPQPTAALKKGINGWITYVPNDQADDNYVWQCPYGVAGDRLWVRETWCQDARGGKEENGEDAVYYRADMPNESVWRGFWKPSIFMPKKYARIWLEITDVRAEKLQDISEDDARAEGIEAHSEQVGRHFCLQYFYKAFPEKPGGFHTAIEAFGALWDSINEKRGYGWNKNPWVWVITFRL